MDFHLHVWPSTEGGVSVKWVPVSSIAEEMLRRHLGFFWFGRYGDGWFVLTTLTQETRAKLEIKYQTAARRAQELFGVKTQVVWEAPPINED